MASQVGGLIQDQNFSVHYKGVSAGAGKANSLNSQRKGGLTGRRPLGDLSNSGKPVLMKAGEKQASKNFSLIEEATGAFKVTSDSRNKRSISKASERMQTGSRKALSDISNSGKPNMHESLKKKQNLKLSAVVEEPLYDAIAHEQFIHNHQECSKAQSSAMDLDQFLESIGLANNGNNIPKVPASPRKPESPLREIIELPIIGRSSRKYELFEWLDSPPPCTPKSPNYYQLCEDDINFRLMESP